MDQVLCLQVGYAAAYLHDVIIHSDIWAEHLRQVAVVLESLRQAGLTANPEKVRSWTKGGTVSGLPFRLRAGAASGRKDCCNCSNWPQTKKEVR